MEKRIGFAQFNVTFGNKQKNLETINKLLQSVDAADLIVLPELCTTGYDFRDTEEVASMAEPFGAGPMFELLQSHSLRLGSVIVAGYAENADGKFFNSSALIDDSGQMHNYRKLHLFSRENELFSAGDRAPEVFDTSAGRIGMMICFDWFFPETARLLALGGAQVIAHPSNLVLPYCQRAMFARSVENHVYTVTANRIGTETNAGRILTFTGASQIITPEGQTLANAGPDEETIKLVSCDLAKADNKQINSYNNLLTDRRVEHYGKLFSK